MTQRNADSYPNIERATASVRGPEEPVAIVGMSCRFPGARALDAFWQLLCNGQDATREAPPGRFPAQSEHSREAGAQGAPGPHVPIRPFTGPSMSVPWAAADRLSRDAQATLIHFLVAITVTSMRFALELVPWNGAGG